MNERKCHHENESYFNIISTKKYIGVLGMYERLPCFLYEDVLLRLKERLLA